jgi:hypothetical protein
VEVVRCQANIDHIIGSGNERVSGDHLQRISGAYLGLKIAALGKNGRSVHSGFLPFFVFLDSRKR